LGWLTALPACLVAPDFAGTKPGPVKTAGISGIFGGHPSKKKCSDAHRKMSNKEEPNDANGQ